MKGMNEWSAKKGSNTAAPGVSRNSKKASGVTRKWVPGAFLGNPALGASQKNMASRSF